jgi:hypothetical protein
MHPTKEDAVKPTTLTRLLLAALAAAALAAALSPGSRAAEPRASGYYQLELDGIAVGLFDNATEAGGDGMAFTRGVGSPALAAWAAGRERGDAVVRLVGPSGAVLRTWRLDDAVPSKWELGELDAGKNEIAIETLEVAARA